MNGLSVRLVAACGAGSLLFACDALRACTDAVSLPLGSIVHNATSGCPDPCPPATGAPGLPAVAGGTLDSSGSPPFGINIVDFSFLPNEPVIKPQTLVRWTNEGLFQHTTTRAGSWNSGVLNPGQFFDHFFEAGAAGLRFDYECSLHFGMEGAIRVAHFGDANLDGIVNLADFNVLAANFGQSERTWDTGDFNGDGLVNLADFNLLAANFGGEVDRVGSLDFGAMAVPEPGAALTAVIGVSLLLRRRRH